MHLTWTLRGDAVLDYAVTTTTTLILLLLLLTFILLTLFRVTQLQLILGQAGYRRSEFFKAVLHITGQIPSHWFSLAQRPKPI